MYLRRQKSSQVALVVKNLPASAGDLRDVSSIPGSGRSPGAGHGNPFQYSCLENPRTPWTVEPGGLLSMRSQSRAQLMWLSTLKLKCWRSGFWSSKNVDYHIRFDPNAIKNFKTLGNFKNIKFLQRVHKKLSILWLETKWT